MQHLVHLVREMGRTGSGGRARTGEVGWQAASHRGVVIQRNVVSPWTRLSRARVGRNRIWMIGSVPVGWLIGHGGRVRAADALPVSSQGWCDTAVAPNWTWAGGGREQLPGVNRVVIECGLVGRGRHGHVLSGLVVATGLRHVEDTLVRGGHGLGAECGAG